MSYFGEGAFGGSTFGAGVDVIDITGVAPANGSTGQSAFPEIIFDVTHEELTPDWGKLRVYFNTQVIVDNGIVVDPSWFLYTKDETDLNVTRFTYRRHPSALPLADASTYTVRAIYYNAEADTEYGQDAWNFTTNTAFAVSTVVGISRNCLRITFNAVPERNTDLFDTGNYHFRPQTGFARQSSVVSVTHVVGNSYVDVCLVHPLTQYGDYDLRVTRIKNALGQVIS